MMIDQLSEVLYFVKGVVRNKWIITVVAAIICAAGWTYVYRMPNIYQSSARVHVDTRTMLRPLLRGLAIQSDVRGLIAIMKKLMFTQENMLKVAELAGMDVDLSSDKEVQELVKKLKDKVKISGGRGEIFSISFESEEPTNAKNVVQAVLSVFSEQAQQSTLSDVDTAKRFIDKQIREYEQRLRNAETAKENFKRENIGLLPGQGGEGRIDVIQSIRQKIEDTKMQLSELTTRRKVLQGQLTEALESGEEWGLTDIVKNDSIEDTRIAELEKRKSEILLKYTESHPSITMLNREIEALKKRKAETEKNNSGFDDFIGNPEAMANPYVQSIKMALNDIDTGIATLNARVQSLQNKLKKEDEQFNARLEIETEMQNLNRDYETIKKNYLSLIDRREQARMSSNVDSQVSALKFKIADPANMPLEPSSPNRPLLYSLVLVAGYVVGIGLALVVVFLRPSFVEAKHLRTVTGLPVLGTITEVVGPMQTRNNRMRLIKFIFVNLLIIAGYSAVMAKEYLS